jgi:hypothetical protein
MRALDYGFFTGDATAPSQMGQFAIRVVNGIPGLTQFFRVDVNVPDLPSSSGEIWVVTTATATGDREVPAGTRTLDEARLSAVRSSLLAAFPDETMCFTTEDREGFLRVIGDQERAVAIAAAVSAVKYFAAWDESDPITVEIADTRFAVSIAANERIYRAVIRRP